MDEFSKAENDVPYEELIGIVVVDVTDKVSHKSMSL
jgi:hypothetical protein